MWFSFRVKGLNLGSVTFKKADYMCCSHWLLILPLPSKVLGWGSWGQILRPTKTESCLKSKDAEYTQVSWGDTVHSCTIMLPQESHLSHPSVPYEAKYPSGTTQALLYYIISRMGLRHFNWTKVEIDVYIKTLLRRGGFKIKPRTSHMAVRYIPSPWSVLKWGKASPRPVDTT